MIVSSSHELHRDLLGVLVVLCHSRVLITPPSPWRLLPDGTPTPSPGSLGVDPEPVIRTTRTYIVAPFLTDSSLFGGSFLGP